MIGFEVTDAERIETLVLTKSSGLMGRYITLPRSAKWAARLELLDGKGRLRMTYLVRTSERGWEVSAYGLVFADVALLEAARAASEHVQQVRDSGAPVATRNVEIG